MAEEATPQYPIHHTKGYLNGWVEDPSEPNGGHWDDHVIDISGGTSFPKDIEKARTATPQSLNLKPHNPSAKATGRTKAKGAGIADILTEDDYRRVETILENGERLPCKGRKWAGSFNGTTPIYTTIKGQQLSARKVIWALRTGDYPKGNLYSLHWECIAHLTSRRTAAATGPDETAGPAATAYVQGWAPEHPVAVQGGLVAEHRRVLYDRLGPGPHSCHWCGREVRWDTYPTAPGELVVDHLDWLKHNNDPDNLVPACRPCNLARRPGSTMRPHAEAQPQPEPQPLRLESEAPTALKAPTRGDEPESPVSQPASSLKGESEEVSTRPTGAWPRLRRSRWARAAAVALAVAAGSAVMVTSPASFLPGASVDRSPRPAATTTSSTTTAPPVEASAVTAPPESTSTTAAPPITMTVPTLGEPCTPSHCPRLDN